MMQLLVFSLVWTIGMTAGVIGLHVDGRFQQESALFQLIFYLMPFFGFWFVRYSWRRYRRFNSVRELETADGVEFVWTEIDGSEGRSRTDPRPEWRKRDGLNEN